MDAHSRKLSVSKISKIHRKTDFLTWTTPQQEECQSRGGRCWKSLARVSENVSFGFGTILVAEKQSENWSKGGVLSCVVYGSAARQNGNF